MKILALDSSGLVASAAIVEDDVLIAEYTTDYKKTHYWQNIQLITRKHIPRHYYPCWMRSGR